MYQTTLKLFILTFFVTSCDQSTEKPPDVDATLIASAEQEISRDLMDPDSARFRNLRVVNDSKSGKAVCGELNAKNSFGGYVGFAPFLWRENQPDGDLRILIDSDGTSTYRWDKLKRIKAVCEPHPA